LRHKKIPGWNYETYTYSFQPFGKGSRLTLHFDKLSVPSLSRETGLDAAEWVKDVLDIEIGLKYLLLQPQARIGMTFPQHTDTHFLSGI